MNCEQAAVRLVEGLYDEQAEQPAELAAHLASCEVCSAEANRLRHAHRALSLLDGDREMTPANAVDEKRGRVATPATAARFISQAAIQRSDSQRQRASRLWRGIGILAAAACVLITAAVLFGLRVNWSEGGVALAWGPDSSAKSLAVSDVQALRQQLAGDQDRWRQAEVLLHDQQAEIASLQASLADYKEAQIAQQQLNQELVTAVQRQFVALQMQMERSDFRISVLKANVRDLGSVLARVTAAVGRPVATTSTPGE